eukprot:gene16499-704_t
MSSRGANKSTKVRNAAQKVKKAQVTKKAQQIPLDAPQKRFDYID